MVVLTNAAVFLLVNFSTCSRGVLTNAAVFLLVNFSTCSRGVLTNAGGVPVG